MRSAPESSANERAARVWQRRYLSELEAAARFRRLASELALLQASPRVVAMADQAARDELRHAVLCAELVRHFGGAVPQGTASERSPVAPTALAPRQRVLYELVAMCCVTETLSTALLGELVERATDALVERNMKTVLRDEVMHSRLGWAFLAEEHAGGAPDCVGPYLPAMLMATVDPRSLRASEHSATDEELLGLGLLDQVSSRRVVFEVLELVIFPGLQRFGVEVGAGRRYLERLSLDHGS